MPRSSFVFYFPYRGFGGVPILFLRMAEKLAVENHDVYLIDFSDGYMAKNRTNRVNLIEYSDSQTPITIPTNSNLILQSDLPWGIPQNFKCDDQTQILFWNCYPYNFIPVLPGRLGHFFLSRPFWMRLLLNTLLLSARNKCKNLVEFLEKNNAVVYMDEPNLRMTQWALKTSALQKKYLPIPVSSSSTFEFQPLDEVLHLAWLGRIADFKINSVLRLIADLKIGSKNFEKKIHLSIIGSGDFEDILKHELNSVKEFSYELIKGIPQNELHSYLNENIDLLFAMGTSALEGGVAFIPTVLMNFSYSKILESYKYNYLFNSKEFSLGDLISTENNSVGINLNTVLDEVKSNKKILALKTSDYVSKNHSLEVIKNSFVMFCEKNNLTYKKLIQSTDFEKPAFYKIWPLIKKLF